MRLNREDAEAHWRYTEKIIMAMLEVVHVAYVESMIHGDKHGVENNRSTPE